MLPKLHILTDTTVQNKYSHLQLAQMAWQAGNVALQYRNKKYLAERDWPELQQIANLAKADTKVLIINDSIELALQSHSAGIHLGQEDADPESAREILQASALIGATVHDLAELDLLRGKAIDYIGVGPVFGTKSKQTGLPNLGLDGLAHICAASPFPVIAIGSITLQDVPDILDAGAFGLAVISAFCHSENPTRIAQLFLEQLES